MSLKFKETMHGHSNRLYYGQRVTTNVDQFQKYERYFIEELLRHAQLDINCNHVQKVLSEPPSYIGSFISLIKSTTIITLPQYATYKNAPIPQPPGLLHVNA